MEEQRRGFCRDLEPIYELYINRLTKEVIEQIDLDLLKSTYGKWEANKDLQVVVELTDYTNPPSEYWKITNQWTRFIENFGLSLLKLLQDEQLKSRALQGSRDDMMKLSLAYWKSRFVDIYSNKTSWKYKGISDLLKYEIASIDRKIEEAKAEERRKQELILAEERRKQYEEQKRIEAERAERKRIERE